MSDLQPASGARPGDGFAAPNRLPFWLGVFLFAVFLLSFSGKLHVMDELALFAAGNNLAQHGRADINSLVWTTHWTPNPPGVWGGGGNLYTKKAPGISVLAAPLIWLGHIAPGFNAVHMGLLTNSLISALTAALLCLWLQDLGFSRVAAALTTLGYGLCTMAWVYARMFWRATPLALLLLAAVWAACRAVAHGEGRRQWVWVGVCGLALGLGPAVRFEAAAAIAPVGAYVLWGQLKKVGRKPLRRAVKTGLGLGVGLVAPAVAVGAWLIYFNRLRFGGPTQTGYSPELLFGSPWAGVWGLLFSPGLGLFTHAPFLLLLWGGIHLARRRLPRLYFWLVAGLSLFYTVFYGAWFAWDAAWSWGPRFLIPTLPLLMLFAAEPLDWLWRTRRRGARLLAWPGVAILAALSLLVNLSGLLVNFNDYFLQFDSGRNFIFNWVKFPPLAHWQILRAGGAIDLIWLNRAPTGLRVEWYLLLPPLILLLLASVNLATLFQRKIPPMPRWAALILTVLLTTQMMLGAAHLAQQTEQAKADRPLLDALAEASRPGDVLLVAMPPFADAAEFSTYLIAYQDHPLPTYAWIESGPRAIHPNERRRVAQSAFEQTGRVWLFERWLNYGDPPATAAAQLNQNAFPVQETWLAGSGRLSLYALAPAGETPAVPLNIPFAGGLTLRDFALFNRQVSPGDTLKLRLTWRAVPATPSAALPPGPTVVFVQLLRQEGGAVAQQDRLLMDLSHPGQSPLLPAHTVSQGYGLPLPETLPPGEYPLIIGLYDATTTQRLPRAGDSPDDFLYLTTVRLTIGD
ncbi:MAG: hypothetical protein ACE5G8_08265 [Anaerolineae bacterium]